MTKQPQNVRTTVLMPIHHYLPGYRSGGPIRKLSNLVQGLGDEYTFKVVTRDRDSGDKTPYPGVAIDAWSRVAKAETLYLSPSSRSFRGLWRLLRDTDYDLLYLNSFFELHFAIKPLLLRRLGLVPRKPVIVAPNGEFSVGALELKGLKKRLYLLLAKLLRLYGGVLWQAASKYEVAEIHREFGGKANVLRVPDYVNVSAVTGTPRESFRKEPGSLGAFSLSRVSRIKNLAGALRMLHGLEGKISFDIYGPLEDESYWAECQEIIRSLPENVTVAYRGAVPHEEVGRVMAEHELFLFPTLGEGFGNVILESLASGCPVLVSDQTPWRGLEAKGVGWDVPLDDRARFQGILQECVDMDSATHASLSRRALEYAAHYAQDPYLLDTYRAMFDSRVSCNGALPERREG